MRAIIVVTAILSTFVLACSSSSYMTSNDPCALNVPTGTIRATNSLTFVPNALTINANQSVNFEFCATTHNVTFDNSNANHPTNIPNSASTTVSRTFTVPGQYEFVCTIHNMHGTVTVQ